jgi:ComF family protein
MHGHWRAVIGATKLAASRITENVFSYLFPPLCLLCDNEKPRQSRWFCAHCTNALRRNQQQRNACPRCSQNRAFRQCTCELAWDYSFESIVSLFDYDDTVRQIAHEIKYGGKWRLAFDLGRIYAPGIPASLWTNADCVLPVPLHPLRQMRRGYNQADCFARGCLASIPHPPVYLGGMLKRCRHTSTQTKLDKEQRRENLKGAFAVKSEAKAAIMGKRVLLVDDIVTTGATTAECAGAILKAGAASVRVLSLARD